MAKYSGFSTFAGLSKLKLSGKDLINRDLLNHIYTIKGERLMMPDFGTSISLRAFSPLDEITITDVTNELKAVVDYDPRVTLIDIAVLALPDNNALVALLDLNYVELGIQETLRIEFPTGS